MLFLKRLLKYSGLFLLSGWMFFIGLLVGRGTAPVEFDTGWFQERLAVIFEDSQTEEPVLEKPELDFYVALQKSDLQEDYDLKLKQTPRSKENSTGKLLSVSKETTDELSFNDMNESIRTNKKAMTSKLSRKQGTTTSVEPTGSGKSEVEPEPQTKRVISSGKVKIGTQPIETKSSLESTSKESLTKFSYKKSEQPSELKNYSGTVQKGYTYTIQIASFNTEADATNHIAKLSAQGYSAYKSSGMVGDKTWYRIRIGNFDNITDAKDNLKKLENSGIKGLIIQKE